MVYSIEEGSRDSYSRNIRRDTMKKIVLAIILAFVLVGSGVVSPTQVPVSYADDGGGE